MNSPLRAGALVAALMLGTALAQRSDSGGPRALPWLHEVRFVCYSPTGFDPRPEHLALPDNASVEDDLTRIRPCFDGLILYSCVPPASEVVRAASRLGFAGVVLGLWNPTDKAELDACKTLIIEYPGLIKAVCIGNEGLCFARYDTAALQEGFDALRTDSPNVPLSTSEPISEYGIPFLQKTFDFHMPNVHPALEPERFRDIDAAVAWVFARTAALESITGKPVLCKETGWPSEGCPEYTPERQRRFWKRLLERSRETTTGAVAFAAFEAFDLPWKTAQSSLSWEAHWGFWTADRQPKPVVEVLSAPQQTGDSRRNQ